MSKLSQAGSVSKIAIGLVMPIMVGFFLGNKLDEEFGTAPWLTLLLLLIGVAIGFTWLYKSITSKDE